ncbi:MAG: hypothetical protein ACREMH_01395, partial [Gemmatimonadales bacterium]
REQLSASFLCWFLGVAVVYAALFATGSFLYGEVGMGLLYLSVAAVTGGALLKTLPRAGLL